MILVIDDFIKDQNLLRDISNDNNFFSDPGIYYWWDGWWNNEAKTLKQRFVRQLVILLLEKKVLTINIPRSC